MYPSSTSSRTSTLYVSPSSTRARSPASFFSPTFTNAMVALNCPIDDSTVEAFREMARAYDVNMNDDRVEELARKYVGRLREGLSAFTDDPRGIRPASPQQPTAAPDYAHCSILRRKRPPPGVLFFDFIDKRSGRPTDLPAGLTLWQRDVVNDMKLMALHKVLAAIRPSQAPVIDRFALQEDVTVVVRQHSRDVAQFRSPVIPRPSNGST
ncbi:hypothetical protein FB451DRAFT_1399668 [Mycena latifolia]|nr:hypothetical protein FB451DRAFT_1399668 [Mycena latifolia]